jgi:hypothetical protein
MSETAQVVGTELIVYEEPPMALLEANGENYQLNVYGKQTKMVRDVDFGVIPGTKKPSLYKSGAEKVLFAYGLRQEYVLEMAQEDFELPLFFYRFRCDLYKGDMLIKSGFGSANTNEKRIGSQSKFDAANGTLKMAKKRAMVDAALSLSGLSDAFTQDMENEEFTKGGVEKLSETDPNTPITTKQNTRMFTIAGKNGIGKERAKEIIKEFGYESSRDVLQKDYDAICRKMEGKE